MNKSLRNINKNIIITLGIILIILMSLIYNIYLNQRDTIITKQREELINLSQVASIQLEEFFDYRKEGLDYHFNETLLSNISIEEIDSYINEFRVRDNEFLERITYLDKKEFIHYYETDITTEVISSYIEKAITDKETIVGPWVYSEEDGHYNIHLIKAIISDSQNYDFIVAEYNLSNIYNETIGKIKVGDYGYCTLKDSNGIIVMHKDENQISIDSLEERKSVYPDLNPEGIEKLVSNQLKGEIGSDIIESYWWGDDEIRQVRKIIGYSPFKIGEHSWVVNAVMSYDEIAGPIENSMYLIIGLIIFVIVISIFIIYYIIKMKYEKEEAIVKLAHAEELNTTINKLRKHEESLSHKNRIQTLGIMSSMMVHDIKNMLMPIFIYTELIKEEGKKNKNIIHDIEEIEKTANNCLDVSKTLLRYSTNKNNIERFDSVKETKEVIKLLKSIIPKDIILKEYIDEGEIFINGDRTEFKQIILNLCTNSYQAMEEYGGVLEIKYYKKDNRGILEIKDNGVGIKEDIQEKIFEPFFTIKSNSESAGLGLSIVAELVKKHNGYITLQSKITEGSCFTVIFNL